MLQIVEVEASTKVSLDSFAADARFAAVVRDLRTQAAQAKPFRGSVWMVSSTAQGGGVAEMMPGLVTLLRELGIPARWAVIGTDLQEFFRLTKRLHNLIHGDASAGIELGPVEARLLEEVGRANAEELAPHVSPEDVVVVHDPQPVVLGGLLKRERGVRAIWRCHIGVDTRNAATRASWRFLRPFLTAYDRAAFSAPEYIPSFLADRATLLYPAIDPGSHKNREFSVNKMVGILCNSGLQAKHEPVPTDDFADLVLRVLPGGGLEPPSELGLLFRPIVLQISRWDRLKGFGPLLEAFAEVKRRLRRGDVGALSERNRRRLELARLVLAGPDPRGVTDDPEGRQVFDELCAAYGALAPDLQADVALLSLPMRSRKENALIVNALQRCASLVVQNSLREGFGLTVAEAMWKRQAVLGTTAVGIRQQIRDGVDGRLTRDPTDAHEIAAHLIDLLTQPGSRYAMGRSAQRRVYDEFLVFGQLRRYLELFAQTKASATS
jgi:trehalose synthase